MSPIILIRRAILIGSMLLAAFGAAHRAGAATRDALATTTTPTTAPRPRDSGIMDAELDRSAPDSVRLTLRQAIASARAQSPSAFAATHRYRASYWQYVTFQADYRPSLDVSSQPMQWERTISQQTLPDGTDAFIPRSQANASADLSLNKVITATGGRLSLLSSLAGTQALEGTGGIQYSSTPVAISLYQPLFEFNPYRWNLRVEPKRYAEARQQFVEELEDISSNAISYFFDLLSAQSTLRDAVIEKRQADTLYQVTRRRWEKSKALQSDVLQSELAALNADLRLARARVDAEVKQQRLATYLGVDQEAAFDLVPATDVPDVQVDLSTAIAQARHNRPLAMSFDRQLLEADRSVAQAHAAGGTTWLSASYGLSRRADRFENLYSEPRVDQQVQLSIHTPVLDWGRSRARVAVAESQREVTRRQVQQSRADFERDVFLKVSQFDIQARQLRIAAHADTVAKLRHKITRERYLAGEGDLNSVNIAQAEKENARRSYLDAMRNYWANYYEVRRATLYDFERREALVPPSVEF